MHTFSTSSILAMHVLLLQEELGKWVIPQDYDPIEAEAAHLIYEADINKVCMVII